MAVLYWLSFGDSLVEPLPVVLFSGFCRFVVVLKWSYYRGCPEVAVLSWVFGGGCFKVGVISWVSCCRCLSWLPYHGWHWKAFDTISCFSVFLIGTNSTRYTSVRCVFTILIYLDFPCLRHCFHSWALLIKKFTSVKHYCQPSEVRFGTIMWATK